MLIFAGLLGMHVIGGFLQATYIGFLAALGSYALFHLLSAIDAISFARRHGFQTSGEGGRVLAFVIVGLAVLRYVPFGVVAGTELYETSSNSSQPTLRPGDSFIVKRTNPAQMARGDFIVFHMPLQTSYIDRVVGLPGDRIQVKGGVLHVNGSPVSRRSIDRPAGAQEGGRYYEETLPDGVVHAIREESDGAFGDNTQEHLVPDGHVFVMGDNRDNAQDSRYIGTIAFDHVLGKASFILSDDFDRLGLAL
jgi:signal peptidase I